MLTSFKSIHFSVSKKSRAGLPRGASAKWGFTLVELIVVITIATIIMTALVIQQRKWDDQLSLNTQTYELALTLRQAQIYSLGVRENPTSTGDKFNLGYGVRISDPIPNQYIFFGDKNKDFKYTTGEELETKTFTRGVVVDRVCGMASIIALGPVGEHCSGEGWPVTLEMVDISFLRPEVNSKSKFLNSSQTEISGFGSYSLPATIYLRSPQGKFSSVKIEANGQISIQ